MGVLRRAAVLVLLALSLGTSGVFATTARSEGPPRPVRTASRNAVALFDTQGDMLLLREDIGRHNAVDKVLGAALMGRFLNAEMVMMVSGRLGFEIAQKALIAGVPIVASISAPSSLAVELADDFGMTAIGFLRGHSMNVYSHPERVTV